ncbi:hypothetical protein GCM10009836_49000 [Pseudonocardia ailaonensis]|uniref:Uncharacterized protein n=1 Tax=Pseudonocardia ailaonensis TaxID=367279 RepID=A0ABN2NEI7_9PSEU
MTTDPLIRRAVAGDADAVATLADLAPTSRDPAVLVAAALSDPDWPALLDRARAVAVDRPDRQLVAVAAAALSGDLDRARLLAREHLAEHPDTLLVAFLAAGPDQEDPR